MEMQELYLVLSDIDGPKVENQREYQLAVSFLVNFLRFAVTESDDEALQFHYRLSSNIIDWFSRMTEHKNFRFRREMIRREIGIGEGIEGTESGRRRKEAGV